MHIDVYACPTCGEAGKRISEDFDGYVHGYSVFVLECARCTLRFVSPLDVPDGLYESIYRHAAVLPGYDRYARYASAIQKHPSPLDMLASAELPYWYARDHLRRGSARTPATVVDLGCGEGYLTYALRRTGVECVGVDLSATVVARARQRFGNDDWFFTVAELADRGFVGADLVVALELVEHVPDPVRLLGDAVALLKADGRVLMTTPNRDASPAEAVWDSDLPPVHLLWFGTKAMTALADRAGCDVVFPAAPQGPGSGARPGVWPPLLTGSGEPTTAVVRARSLPWRIRRRMAGALAGVAHRLEAPPWRQLPGLAGAGRPPATLGAVFTPRSAG
jgi:SAM-dependent methyltransferase